MAGLRCRSVKYLSLLVALLVAEAGAQGTRREGPCVLHRCVRRCISAWIVCAEAALSLGLATTALPVDEQALLDMMAGASAGVLEAGPSAGPRNYLTDKARLSARAGALFKCWAVLTDGVLCRMLQGRCPSRL